MRRFVALVFVFAFASVAFAVTGCNDIDVTAIRDAPVKIDDVVEGRGRPVRNGDLLRIDYRVVTEDGRELQRYDDFRFLLGDGAVIRGIEEGVPGMRTGGQRIIKCSPGKHWGRKGMGNIPPNTTLLFHVRLVAIEDA